MAIKDEVLKFDVVINGNNAQSELNKLGKEQRNLREEEKMLRQEKIKLMKTDSDYKNKLSDLTSKINANRAAQANNTQAQSKFRKEIGVVSFTMNQLGKEARRLQSIMNSLTPGTAEWAKYNEQLEEVATRQKEVRNATKGTAEPKQSGDSSSLMSTGKTLVGAYFLKEVATKVASITATMQKYNAVLKNTLGSQEAANKAIGDIKKFAADTPFQVDEMTEAYVALTNQGFQPTMEEMRKLGDLASSTGKDFGQLSEAIINAQTGQNRSLLAFGIKAQVAGDKVSYTFKGQTTTIENNAEAIRGYILSLGDLEGVSGGMAAISKTLGGQYSNLLDNVDQLAEAVGYALLPFMEAGLGIAAASVEALKALAETYKDNKDVIDIVLAGITAYIVATKAATIWDKTKLLWNNTLISSFKKLYATIIANPWAAIIALVVAAGVAIYKYVQYMDTAAQVNRTLADVRKTANAAIADEKIRLEQLLKIAKDEKQSKEDRLEAVKQINKISPEYLGNITLEKINTAETTSAVNKYTEAILKKAQAQAATEKLAEIAKEEQAIYLRNKLILENGLQSEVGYFEFMGMLAKGVFSKGGVYAQVTGVEDLKRLEATRKALLEMISTKDILNQSPDPVVTEEENKTSAARKAPKVDLAPYKDITQEFFDFQAQLEKQLYDLRLKYGLVSQLELYQQEVEEFKNSQAAKLLSEEEYMQAMDNLHAKYKAKDIVVPEEEEMDENYSNAELQALLTADYQRALDEQTIEFKRQKFLDMVEANEMSEMEAMDRINALNEAEYNERKQKAIEHFNQLGGLATAISEYNMSLMEIEKNKEIEAAGGNKEKIEAIEKKYAKQKQKEQLKMAYINMALAIGNAIATTIPFLPNGLIAAATAGLQGMAQVNMIKSQMAEGGYTDVIGAQDGKKYRARNGKKPSFAGMLEGANVLLANEDGKQEYFVSNPALNSNARDPMGFSVADHVKAIDYLSHQRVVPQRASGGYSGASGGHGASQTSAQPNGNDFVIAAQMFMTGATMLKNGVPAYFGDDQVREIRTRSSDFDKIEKM